MSVTPAYICSAIGTPLNDLEEVHVEGLAKHLEQQQAAGINGILVGGTMGLMQLLLDKTYQDLVRQSVTSWKGQGEVLVGVGDASFVRTRERIRFVNELKADGVVVLAPYFVPFSQCELAEYFESLADESRAPLFLYDLPQRTGVQIQVETVMRLAEHPNIIGIKCSGEITEVRRLIDKLAGSSFRVILAQPLLLDILLHSGFREHLDGVFAIFPNLARDLATAVDQENWEEGSKRLQVLRNVLIVIRDSGIFSAMTAILNTSGVPGNFAPRPYGQLQQDDLERLLDHTAVKEALAFEGVC